MDRPSSQDIENGVIAALLKRTVQQRIPNAMAIKRSLDRGNRISDRDLQYMLDVLSHARDNQSLRGSRRCLSSVTRLD